MPAPLAFGKRPQTPKDALPAAQLCAVLAAEAGQRARIRDAPGRAGPHVVGV